MVVAGEGSEAWLNCQAAKEPANVRGARSGRAPLIRAGPQPDRARGLLRMRPPAVLATVLAAPEERGLVNETMPEAGLAMPCPSCGVPGCPGTGKSNRDRFSAGEAARRN